MNSWKTTHLAPCHFRQTNLSHSQVLQKSSAVAESNTVLAYGARIFQAHCCGASKTTQRLDQRISHHHGRGHHSWVALHTIACDSRQTTIAPSTNIQKTYTLD